MKAVYSKFLKKLVLPLIIFSALIASISIISIFILQYGHIEHTAKHSFQKTQKLFERKFKEDIQTYEEFIKLISKDKKAVELFTNKKRDELYNYYKNIYTEFNDKFHLSHFYFHNTNKINFLRVHNPKKYNDKIERVTLNQAIERKGLGYGIEFGIFHNLTLRVVYPWKREGKIIGYIELGKEIDYFTPELAQIEESEVVFTIQKDVISKEDYKVWLSKSKNNTKFKELTNYYIIDSSFKTFPKDILKIINSSSNLENIVTRNNDHIYYVNSLPFEDIMGNEIGKMYVFTDLTSEHDFLYNFIFKIALIVGTLIFFLVLYFYRLVKLEESSINKKEEKSHSIAITDALTSIYNRRYFDIYFESILNKVESNESYISLLILDIDNFKKYNDYYGHQKGDKTLQKVASCIQKSLRRKDDKCFRIGGEEFAVILESLDKDVAKNLAGHIIENIEKLNIEHKYNEDYNKITISVGVYSVLANSNLDKKTIYNSADKALYKAKKQGKNCFCEYEE